MAFFGRLCKELIQPARCRYSMTDLGATDFIVPGPVRCERNDFSIKNGRGHQLQCSHWVPRHQRSGPVVTPQLCVVYLHGVSSGRIGVLEVLEYLLARGLAVLAFDFAGSGKSGGEHVSFGHHESGDVECVVDHLLSSGLATEVALWGHSMGASTAVLRAVEDANLAACVMDSPFSDFQTLACEVANRTALKVPCALVRTLLRRLQKEVKSQADFNLLQVSPVRVAGKARCPALFAAGDRDNFVRPKHAEALYHAWGGKVKHLMSLPCGHNDDRPFDFLNEASDFLLDHLLQAESQRALTLNSGALAEPVACWQELLHSGTSLLQPPMRGALGEHKTPRGLMESDIELFFELAEEELPGLVDIMRGVANLAEVSPKSKPAGGGSAERKEGQVQLQEQLMALGGIEEVEACRAAARCSRAKGAVKWLHVNL